MNTVMLTYAAAAGGLAMIPWIYGWIPRVTAWFLAVAFACLALGWAVWRETLATETQGKGGVGLLLAAFTISALCFYFEAVHRRKDPKKPKMKDGVQQPAKVKPHHRRHHYHRIRTMVISAAFGTLAVIAYARKDAIVHEFSQSPGATAKALSKYTAQVHNGTATQAMSVAQAHTHIWMAVAALALLWILLRGIERKRNRKPFFFNKKDKNKGGGGGGGRRGGQQAIPGGDYPAIGG